MVAFLRAQREAGRSIVLLAGRDPAAARVLAERLGLFGAVLETGAAREASARLADGFNLLVRGPIDRELVAAASALVLPEGAPPPPGASAPVVARLVRSRVDPRVWLRALRLHQWAKNLLVFVPVTLAGPLATAGDWGRATLAFLALGLLASAGYVINDLLDLEADRRHPTKCGRPFAAGILSLRAGLLAVPALLVAAALVATALPPIFALVGGVYLVLTLGYSLRLKRIPMLDVVVLGGLFSLRLFAGAEVITAPLSYWLLTFSMFLFLSLALVKRYAELDELATHGGSDLADRGYSTRDLPLLLATGLSSGVAATVIYVVYLVAEQFPKDIYTRPGWLWLVFPLLLLWLLRVWRLALHGRMSQDPVLFALTDRASLLVGAAVLACILAAW